MRPEVCFPGVTVEAASPALIEGVRTAVTDGTGNYNIVDLRPGEYAVTFTLPGFSTIVREGIELTTGFTANVNADMPVGGVEETITVTGESPVVDIRNTRDQTVLSKELLASAPTAHKNGYSFSALTLGAAQTGALHDVGGNQHEVGGTFSYHGTNPGDSKWTLDGMGFTSMHGVGGGNARFYHPNPLAIEEVNLGLSSGDAEHATAGLQLNMIPSEGGNQFSLVGNVVYANEDMESDNLSDDIRSRGLNESGGVLKSWDNGVAVGGPIRQDRIWFLVAPRFWGNRNRNPGGFFNKTQGTQFHTPDLSRPADADLWDRDLSARLTWQVTPRNKVTLFHSEQRSCFCTFTAGPTLAPEFFVSYNFKTRMTQGTWTVPATSELLLQGGLSYGGLGLSSRPQDNVKPTDISIIDAGTGVLFNSTSFISFSSGLPYSEDTRNDPLHGRFSASYVTGSHSFKVGVHLFEGFSEQNGRINQDLRYLLFNTFPILITQFATPLQSDVRVRSRSLFAQDQWTIDRLSLNLGVRFDYFKGRVNEKTVPAGSWVPERSWPAVDDVPNFKDITPRLGAAYDLFGDGKTAIKASFGMYVGSEGAGLTELNNPGLLAVTETSRTWFDADTDFQPDCDLTNFAANGECGAINNNLFGLSQPGISYADNVIRGWGNRTRQWQSSVSLQQELAAGVVGEHRVVPHGLQELPCQCEYGGGGGGLRHLLCDGTAGFSSAGRRRQRDLRERRRQSRQVRPGHHGDPTGFGSRRGGPDPRLQRGGR